MEPVIIILVIPLIGAVLSTVLQKVCSPEFLAFFTQSNDDAKLLEKLKFSLLTISVVLNDAEEKGITNPLLALWLDELKALVYEAKDVVDEISMEILHRVESNEKLKKKIKSIANRLKCAATHKDLLLSGEKISSRLQTTCLLVEPEVLGRENDKEAICEFLIRDSGNRNNVVAKNEIRVPAANGDGVGVVTNENGVQAVNENEVVGVAGEIPVLAIVGMPGVGKTTIAQLLFNGERVQRHFHLGIWVHVSEQLNVLKVTQKIYESVLQPAECHRADLDTLQIRLQSAIKEKIFLLVLDDVWCENFFDWAVLMRPFKDAASGSRIIVTTRSSRVASAMRAHSIHQLRPLSDVDCWSLFTKHALRPGIQAEHPQIRQVRGEIMKKCGGLPLVATTLARLLYSIEEIDEWGAVLNGELWELPSYKNGILPALRLSYYHLPSHLKRCFAYCSMFPKGYRFKKEDLVLLWMAEGLSLDPKSNKLSQDVGNDYFSELLSRSFFQQALDKQCYTMHDLFSDLAQSVAGDFCFKCEDGIPRQVPDKVRHFSFKAGKFDVPEKFDAFQSTSPLWTFLPLSSSSSEGTHFLSPSALKNLLQAFNHLHVLSFPPYKIDKLPKSICNLKYLRFLNLSQTGIRALPDSVCNLYNLETLLLSGCREFTVLPKNMHKLVNLQCLDISETAVKEMPSKFGKLKNLHLLTAFVVGDRSSSSISSIRELMELLYLRKLSILKLENVNVEDASAAKLKEKKFLRELVFQWRRCAQHKDVLQLLQPHEKLKKLTIINYGDESFPNWVGDASFYGMVSLRLTNCENCLSLPPLGQLPSLKAVHISKMKKVTSVGSEFCGRSSSSIEPFSSLETLEFEDMPVWSSFAVAAKLPVLQKLSLNNCPNLIGNLPKYLPALKTLHISKCRQLELSFFDEDTADHRQYKALKRLHIRSSCDCFLSFPLDFFDNLEELQIQDCSHLKYIVMSIHNLRYLRKLEIQDCCNFEFSAGRWLSAPNLESLLVSNCNSLTSMPEQMDSLTSLQTLSIFKCPRLASFPEGGLPASLRSFTVEACNNDLAPNVQWGLNNMNSLTSLVIKGGCIGMMSFPGEVQLPNTVTSIDISGLEDLRSLSHMRNLICLKSLNISNCKKLDSMSDEPLPLTLNSLNIFDCELMISRCQEGGADWDKISHISDRNIH